MPFFGTLWNREKDACSRKHKGVNNNRLVPLCCNSVGLRPSFFNVAYLSIRPKWSFEDTSLSCTSNRKEDAGSKITGTRCNLLISCSYKPCPLSSVFWEQDGWWCFSTWAQLHLNTQNNGRKDGEDVFPDRHKHQERPPEKDKTMGGVERDHQSLNPAKMSCVVCLHALLCC